MLANMIEQRTIRKEVQLGKNIIKSPEAKEKTYKFTPEAKDALVNKLGLVVIPLTGKSILDYREAGKLESSWHRDYPDFEGRKSIMSEAAINLREIFLLKSNYKPFSKQKEMVVDYDKKIRKEVHGVKAIIGNTPTNLEIIKNAYELYGGENGVGDLLRENSVRCAGKSPIDNIYNEDGFSVTVGRVDPEGRLLITSRDTGRAKDDVGVIAIVVPEDLPVEEPAK